MAMAGRGRALEEGFSLTFSNSMTVTLSERVAVASSPGPRLSLTPLVTGSHPGSPGSPASPAAPALLQLKGLPSTPPPTRPRPCSSPSRLRWGPFPEVLPPPVLQGPPG